MRLPSFVLAAAAAFSLAAPLEARYRDRSQPMDVVEALDIERYLGRWYEIARFPNRFELGCVGVTADYALRDDGKISVVNTCRKGSLDGPVEAAEGVARIIAPGKLEVSFVPWLPFASGDYWVLYVDPAYSIAVVGEPKGRTGWILARDTAVPKAEYDKAVSVLETMGYDTSQLQLVAH